MTAQFDEKQMIQNMDKWPGETLCLKKKPTGDEKPVGFMGYSAFGVITTSRPPIVVYLRSNDEQKDFTTTKTYDTVDALLADGWEVD